MHFQSAIFLKFIDQTHTTSICDQKRLKSAPDKGSHISKKTVENALPTEKLARRAVERRK